MKKQNEREPLPTTFAEAMQEPPGRADPVVVDAEVVPPASNEKEKTEAPPAPPAQQPQGPKAHVALNERGLPDPKDLDGIYRVIGALYRGKAFPAWVKSPEQAFAVAQFLKNLGLEVMTGIQHVCEVNGRLTLWGEGPLAAVRASGKLKSIKETFLTSDYKEISLKNKNLDAPLFAAVCVMVRADNGERIERAFTTLDAQKANQGVASIWKGYQRIMFKRKARAECIKDLFGDVVLGAGIAEYDFEVLPDAAEANGQPRGSLADRMNEDNPQLEDKSGEVQTQ